MTRTAKLTVALITAAGVVFGGVASASAATTPLNLNRKVIVTDSKVKVGTLEKERGFTDRKGGSFTNEKER